MNTRLRWVIGHRGACAYWPENTWPSIAGAHGLGADWVEVDAVVSRDGRVVLAHDLWLEPTTDVAVRFPGRARADGRSYAVDFDWAELAGLRVGARRDGAGGEPVFPGRRLAGAGETGLCRLEEAVAGLRALNARSGRRVGLVVEVKAPAWHLAQGVDLGELVRGALAGAGDLPVVVETFDAAALRAWRATWPEGREGRWRWWQLLGENAWGEAACDFDALRSEQGLREVASYADGVGVNLERVTPELTGWARATGLSVCGYTLRLDGPEVVWPEALRAGWLDGVFTDHPDVVAAWRAGG